MSQKNLSENTLKIYVYIIIRGKKRVGPREVQRAMNFASPSSAIFHLKKLVENGLIEENRGEYYLNRVKRIGVLSNFYVIRRYLVPKDLVYLLLVGIFAFIDIALLTTNYISQCLNAHSHLHSNCHFLFKYSKRN